MGHIAHLRNQFKNIWEDLWFYYNIYKERKNLFISFLRIEWSLFGKPWVSMTKDALCQVWLKLATWFRRRRLLNFINVFSLFRNYLPMENSMVFICTNLNPLHPRMLCAMFGWNWLSGSGEEEYLIYSMHFRVFVIISPWKRVWPFIWINYNPLNPRFLCAKFG